MSVSSGTLMESVLSHFLVKQSSICSQYFKLHKEYSCLLCVTNGTGKILFLREIVKILVITSDFINDIFLSFISVKKQLIIRFLCQAFWLYHHNIYDFISHTCFLCCSNETSNILLLVLQSLNLIL